MRVFYKSKEAALEAAKAYQEENGGYIHEVIIPELADEDTGRIIGSCRMIIVSDVPYADLLLNSTWEEGFYYDFEEL